MIETSDDRIQNIVALGNRVFVFTGFFRYQEVTNDIVNVRAVSVERKTSMSSLAIRGIAGAVILGSLGAMMGIMTAKSKFGEVVFIIDFTLPVRKIPLYVRTDNKKLINCLIKKITWLNKYGK